MNETKRLADRILKEAVRFGRAVGWYDFPECGELDKDSLMELMDLLKDYGELKIMNSDAKWESFQINKEGMKFAKAGGYEAVEAERSYQAEYRKADLEEKKLSKKKYRLDKIALAIAILSLIISIISLTKGFL